MNKLKLFISYGRKDDIDFVEKLYDDLKDEFDVWWDKLEMRSSGKSWSEELIQAIDSSDKLLLVVGPHAMKSDVVRGEWTRAKEQCIHIIPILRIGTNDERDDYAQVPPELGDVHVRDFRQLETYSQELERLVRDIRTPMPLGALYGQFEGVPASYIDRTEITQDLLTTIQSGISDIVVTSATQIRASKAVAVRGKGGLGKTVLANAFGQSCEVRKIFHDGIIWLEITNDPVIMKRFEQIGQILRISMGHWEDELTARDDIRKALQSKTMLLILDDVWHERIAMMFQNLVMKSKCRLLVTTRLSQVGSMLEAKEYALGIFNQEQSIELLTIESGRDVAIYPELYDIATELDEWPLALSIVAKYLRIEGQSPKKWLKEYKSVKDIELVEPLGEERAGSFVKCMDVSVNEFERQRGNPKLYYSLGIFPEDVWIPEQVVIKLWQTLDKKISDRACKHLLNNLANLALIDRQITQDTQEDNDKSVIRFHDLLREYNRAKLDWKLREAGKEDSPRLIETQRTFLKEVPAWLEEVAQRGTQGIKRDFELEYLVVRIYQDLSKLSPATAKDLLHTWLQRENPLPTESRYESRIVAVQAIFYIQNYDLLLAALLHSDEVVRGAAISQAYYSYRQIYGLEDEQEHKLAFEEFFHGLIKPLGDRCRDRGILSIRAIPVFMELILLLITFEYQTHKEQVASKNNETETNEDSNVQRLVQLIQEVVQKVLYLDNAFARIVSWPIKAVLIRLAIWIIVRRLPSNTGMGTDKATDTVATKPELEMFFRLLQEKDSPFRQLIPYFNREYVDADGNLFVDSEEARKHLFKIYGSDPDTETCYIYAVFAALMVVARGINDPNGIRLLIEKLLAIDTDSFVAERYINLLGTWRHIMFFTKHDIHKDWVEFAEKETRAYYELDSKYNRAPNNGPYGFIESPAGGQYIFYPIMMYAQILNRSAPTEALALVEEYMNDANTVDNGQLRDKAKVLHILRGFTDPRAQLENYRWVLKFFRPYLFHEDAEIQEAALNAVTYIRSKREKQVDEMLRHESFEKGDGPEIKATIQAQAFERSSFDLVLGGFHDFLAILLAYTPVDELKWFYDLLEQSMSQRNLDASLRVSFNYLLKVADTR